MPRTTVSGGQVVYARDVTSPVGRYRDHVNGFDHRALDEMIDLMTETRDHHTCLNRLSHCVARSGLTDYLVDARID